MHQAAVLQIEPVRCTQMLPEQYSDRRKELMHDCKPGIRFLFNAEPFQKHLEDAGLINRTTLGDAQVLAIRTRVLVDETMRGLVSELGKFFQEEFLEWMKKAGNQVFPESMRIQPS